VTTNDPMGMFEQIQKMQADMRAAQDALANEVIEATVGGGVVKATVNGEGALLSIAILLYITLRRFSDVLLTLIPLLLAGVVTLEVCVLIDLPLNFANIIALPLLLGIGVAFKIYYIMAWRGGQTNLLQSSLTRAVFFSALTTMTAFGSLWLSSHPGTSSMGKLLALSLITTLAAAVLFQPVLMGRPREIREPALSDRMVHGQAFQVAPPASLAPAINRAQHQRGWIGAAREVALPSDSGPRRRNTETSLPASPRMNSDRCCQSVTIHCSALVGS